MRHLFLTILVLVCTMSVWAQTQSVRITTSMDGVSVAILNADKKLITVGKTPFIANLEADSVYTYMVRHKKCHSDSGFMHIDLTKAEIELPIRPYQIQVNWEVNPQDADFKFDYLREKNSSIKGKTWGQTIIGSGRYRLTVSRPQYRQYRQKLAFRKDSVITFSRDLQHCPTRLILALNAGRGSVGSLPLGITLAYGGVHGVYGRYTQTILNMADGDDFDTKAMVDVLTNPYSKQTAEYQSFVAGYQYLTPHLIYLQGGLGYGTQYFNWLSADDGKRHRFSPDTSSGIILDFGLGYAFGRYYAGAAFQAMTGSKKPFSPACAMFNFGVCL